MANKTVLLVEDDETLRKLYKTAFQSGGFTVFEAENGQIAIDIALMNKPKAITLDLMMPRQGGLGALRVFRTLPETKNVPIVVMTALPNREYKDAAAPYVQGFFLKTQIQPGELVKFVAGLVEG